MCNKWIKPFKKLESDNTKTEIHKNIQQRIFCSINIDLNAFFILFS